MFYTVSSKITQTLIKYGCISQEDATLYSYGFRQLFMMLLNISITLIIGILLNEIWQSIVFSLGYIPIRSFAGGYHAKTPQRCTIFSSLMILTVLLVIKFVTIPDIVILFLWIASSSIIISLSPIQDNHKPLDKVEKSVYRRKTIILLILDSSIIIVSMIFSLHNISYCLVLSLLCLSIMLILGSIKNTFGKKL